MQQQCAAQLSRRKNSAVTLCEKNGASSPGATFTIHKTVKMSSSPQKLSSLLFPLGRGGSKNTSKDYCCCCLLIKIMTPLCCSIVFFCARSLKISLSTGDPFLPRVFPGLSMIWVQREADTQETNVSCSDFPPNKKQKTCALRPTAKQRGREEGGNKKCWRQQ